MGMSNSSEAPSSFSSSSVVSNDVCHPHHHKRVPFFDVKSSEFKNCWDVMWIKNIPRQQITSSGILNTEVVVTNHHLAKELYLCIFVWLCVHANTVINASPTEVLSLVPIIVFLATFGCVENLSCKIYFVLDDRQLKQLCSPQSEGVNHKKGWMMRQESDGQVNVQLCESLDGWMMDGYINRLMDN